MTAMAQRHLGTALARRLVLLTMLADAAACTGYGVPPDKRHPPQANQESCPSGVTPQSDADFCVYQHATCGGTVTAADTCSVERTVSCPNSCRAPGVCSQGACTCPQQTEGALCAAHYYGCGVGGPWTDSCGNRQQPSCGTCPLSACSPNHHCTLACTAQAYGSTPTPLAAVSTSSGTDLLFGASADGNSLLVQHDACGSAPNLWLYDGSWADATYAGADITADPNLSSLDVSSPYFVTLTADGLGIVAATASHHGFEMVRRFAIGSVELAAPSEAPFTAVNSWLGNHTPLQAGSPAVSGDGRSFFFRVVSSGSTASGFYEARRGSTDDAFGSPAGPLSGSINATATQITGVSPYALAVFVQGSGSVVRLVRPALDQPFANALTATGAAQDVRPVGDCSELVADGATSACNGGDIVVIGAP